MKKILSLLLAFVICISLCACETDSVNKRYITGEWTVEALDEETLGRFEDAVSTYWRDNCNATVGDEVIKDIVIFKPDADAKMEYINIQEHYQCIVYGSVHLKEMYRNDGSTYFKISDNPSDELRDIYFDGTIVDTEVITNFVGLHTNLYDTSEQAIESIKEDSRYDNMVSVLTEEQRVAFVDRIANCKDIYDEMHALLKDGKIEDARNLYYSTTDLTYQQSQKCLIAYAMYSELEAVKGLPINVLDYELSSGDDPSSDNKNDIVIFVSYTFNRKYFPDKEYDIREVHITLDVENKTYKVRERK